MSSSLVVIHLLPIGQETASSTTTKSALWFSEPEKREDVVQLFRPLPAAAALPLPLGSQGKLLFKTEK